MSKALSIGVAVVLGAIALTPVAYSMKNPTGLENRNTSTIQINEKSSDLQKISYALGYALAQQVPPEADNAALVAGYQDARNDKKPALTEQQIAEAFSNYQKNPANQPDPAVAAVSSEEAKQFFAENAKQKGVKTTDSGLQYVIVKQGKGKQATPNSKVTVHYTGRLLNGQIFDSSVQHGKPATFPLNAVIKGWTEGLSLMKEGDQAILFIPAELAYGKEEKPGIPANSPLVFEVELIKVD